MSMPSYALFTAGSLAVSLVSGLVAGVAPAADAVARKSGKGCRIGSFWKIDNFRPRNFYIPGTRYIDGPGGVMRVWVMRAYTIRSEFEIEDWHERERRRTRFGPVRPGDGPAEITREVEREVERERGHAVRRAGGEDPGRAADQVTGRVDGTAGGADDAEREVTHASKIKIKDGRAVLTRADERELIRTIRHMVSPLISDDHTVEVGHEYTRKISPGKYGYARYRVFGYRVKFSKWWRGDDCRVHWAASGVAGVPARVEGWVYRESKRLDPKWLRGR